MMAAPDRLSALQYQEALRQAVRFRVEAPIGDPLAVALERIERNPAFSQSRLLTRLLVALTSGKGEFRRAEVAGLDAPTYALAIGLMDAFGAGSQPLADWERAVVAARTAELGASR
jgi:hypothetical protein